MKILHTLGIVALGAAASACGASVPQELANARTAYTRAEKGPAQRTNPGDLHTAKQTLDVAETSFDADGASDETKDYAYTAQRRAEATEARARAALQVQRKDQILVQIHAREVSDAQLTSAELGKAKDQLAAQGAALQSERDRRTEADKRTAQAMSDLSRLGAVKQDPRGLVLTLSGSVLFASGKSTLLPAATASLSNVAAALKEQKGAIVVEGYTDSSGGQALNERLSRERAEAVRGQLVAHGVESDRITAVGLGPSRAIADNASPEGRANNRRVEIVIQPAKP